MNKLEYGILDLSCILFVDLCLEYLHATDHLLENITRKYLLREGLLPMTLFNMPTNLEQIGSVKKGYSDLLGSLHV